MSETKRGCPNCEGTDLILCDTELYTNYWQCNDCDHNFSKHLMWQPDIEDKSMDNVVNLIPPEPKPVERQLEFKCGPSTIQKDITPYEAAMLNLFILRAAGRDPMMVEDAIIYTDGTLRHLLIRDEGGVFVQGDKFLTEMAESVNVQP